MQRSEIIFEVAESPEGGYEARALGEAIFTEAETLEELRKNVREAVRCHFDDPENRPLLIRLHMVKDEVLSA
jgi:predicted RNase H-like HicB family nuclease